MRYELKHTIPQCVTWVNVEMQEDMVSCCSSQENKFGLSDIGQKELCILCIYAGYTNEYNLVYDNVPVTSVSASSACTPCLLHCSIFRFRSNTLV